MVTFERDRYIVFRILPKSVKIELKDLRSFVWSMYQKLFGLYGTTDSGLFFEEYDEETNIGLIRCNSKSIGPLMTSLALITSIDTSTILFLPLYITGLINKAKKYISSLRSSNHNVD